MPRTRPLPGRLAAALAALPLAAAAPAVAPLAASAQPAAPEAAGGPMLHGKLELSLGDAIQMGLENNLSVQVERYEPMIADLDTTVAWGAFEPELFSEIAYRDSRAPNSFALSGVDENVNRSVGGEGGLRGLFPLLGTEYTATFAGQSATTNSQVTSLSPQYDTGWNVELAQPILRDLIWSEPWTQVRTSRLVLASREEAFRRAVMDEVQKIEDAYWTLIAAEEALRVANKSLETAGALLEQTRTQYEVGVVSKVEVTEAEAGVSQREVEQIVAENTYRNQQDVLIDLVLGPNLRAQSSLEIRPTDRPDDFTPYEVDVETAVARAFENRPELAEVTRELETQEMRLSLARNQRLPDLDGIFAFGQTGLAGSNNSHFNQCRFVPESQEAACLANPQAFDPTQGQFRESFDDYHSSPAWVIGARLSVPIPNSGRSASASRAQVELARTRTRMRRVEQDIIIGVREAARNLVASQERIAAARDARRAAAEQLRAEEIRLEYGESTPFDVLQREEDLVERERGEIEAFQEYRMSVTALDRAQGTLLRNRNINIAEVAPLR